ncbi:hypothetical protein KL86DYS2_12507 [uncultured Dysgonomonas sp.]|uniref:Uncharacterized protein n=1 Tax=uncultured Dysgonomonas sp. TaxID=206096 RepID=A0A212JWL0_9BACT|nr:hypothetical protein [uncultured Dysgonomonas sp.]SBW03841.1 hypothetical protein KL86DYS2_12507 [uncultured Dysgonomonas sp.]
MAIEIKGTIIDQCAHFNIFQAEHNGFSIIYRVWRNGKVEFKVTANLISSGIAKVESGILQDGKEYWIDVTKRGE